MITRCLSSCVKPQLQATQATASKLNVVEIKLVLGHYPLFFRMGGGVLSFKCPLAPPPLPPSPPPHQMPPMALLGLFSICGNQLQN